MVASMRRAFRAGWVFSLARSGSSVTAYAAAAPWGHAVADEPFGPWDRTGEPYFYPREHLDLKREFYLAGERMDGRTRELAERVLGEIAWRGTREETSGGAAPSGGTGNVVVKHPHTMLSPEDWRAHFRDPSVQRDEPGGRRGGDACVHRRILLIRNPLHRLNSMLWRKQDAAVGANWDLETFRVFARRWLEAAPEERVAYDELRRDPHAFFRRIYRAWEWEASDADVEKAVAYARTKYHDASAHVFAKADPTKGVVSEKQRALPREAVEVYLADDLVRAVSRELGGVGGGAWAMEAGAYGV